MAGEDLNRKKVKSKKRKKRKKTLKSSSSSSSFTKQNGVHTRRQQVGHNQNDNYEIQDMEIDNPSEAILADKDMRNQVQPKHHQQQQQKVFSTDEPKTISFMELMIDYDLNTYSQAAASTLSPNTNKKQDSYYSNTNDLYPKRYFEYQKIAPTTKPSLNKREVIIESSSASDNDDDINKLRDNLLNDLNKKRAQKKQKTDNIDLSHYETTIQLAKKQIEEANALKNQVQATASNSKIMPIIIKLGETSSEDDDDNSNTSDLKEIPTTAAATVVVSETFQSNINLFLNAAKEQAKLEIKKKILADNKITIHSQTNTKTQRIVIKNTSSPSKLNATIKRLKETSRKDEIRIVRDRINIKRYVFFIINVNKMWLNTNN